MQPEKRVKQLQTGHADQLNLFYQQDVDAKEAKRIEKMVHRTLGHLRLRGEWFKLSVTDAISEVKFGLMSSN